VKRWAVVFVLALAGCGGTTESAKQPVSSAVPDLPAEGFAVQSGSNIEFRDLDGRVVGRMGGYRLAPSPGVPLAVMHRGKGYVMDLRTRRVVRLPRHELLAAVRRTLAGRCRVGPARYLLCGRNILRAGPSGRRAVVVAARPSGVKVGHWEQAFLAPDGRRLLVQWSAECEIPITFVIQSRGGPLRVVSGERNWADAPESIALGFASDGRAMVLFPVAACGSGIRRAGIYAVDVRTFGRRFVFPVRRGAAVVMWGRTGLAPPP
jgi:hypothetical protein